MPNPTWPAGLPQAWGQDSTLELADNILRTPMATGPAKLRRRSTAEVDQLRFSLLLTNTELTTLRTFYRSTLKKTLPFDWRDYRLLPSVVVATFRFTKAPLEQYVGGPYWTAQIELEQLP